MSVYFTSGQVAKILGVSGTRISQIVSRKLLRPSIGPEWKGHRILFSLDDVYRAVLFWRIWHDAGERPRNAARDVFEFVLDHELEAKNAWFVIIRSNGVRKAGGMRAAAIAEELKRNDLYALTAINLVELKKQVDIAVKPYLGQTFLVAVARTPKKTTT